MTQVAGDHRVPEPQRYPARLEVDYPERLDRVTTVFRVFLIIPIAIVLSLVSAAATSPPGMGLLSVASIRLWGRLMCSRIWAARSP